MKTIVTFLLDETGSMAESLDTAIHGFNEYVDSLRGSDYAQDIRFTLIKWDSAHYTVVHDGVAIEEVVKLNRDNFIPGQMTPLYDTIGRAIGDTRETAKRVKKVEGEKPAVLFVILTDGYENFSKQYKRERIFDMIKERQEKGWQFVYLGADPDTYAASAAIGIPRQSTLRYVKGDEKGLFVAFANASARYMRHGSSASDAFFAGISGDVDDEGGTSGAQVKGDATEAGDVETS